MLELFIPIIIHALIGNPVAVNTESIIMIQKVETGSVIQYWNTRCQVNENIDQLPDTLKLFPGLPIADIYVEYQNDIYFVAQLDDVEELPLNYFVELHILNRGAKATWSQVFYIVAPDETNPGAGRLDLLAGTLETRLGCSTHRPIIAPWEKN